MANPILEWAIYYRDKLGYSIIPVGQNKRPIISWEEFQTRKASLEEISSWWEKYPNANIGIVTGDISGVCGVDLDGDDAKEAITEFIPESTITPTCNTPRGGQHWYFQSCGLQSKNNVMHHVDFKSNGGYLVAPPSVLSNGRYSWVEGLRISDVALPSLPALFINKINNSINSFIARGGDDNGDFNRLPTTSNDFTMFKQGRRDDDLFHMANVMLKGGAKPEEAYQALVIIARNCNPPFPEKEVEIKIKSALERASKREMNYTELVRDFVVTSKGTFSTSNVFNRLQVTSRQEKKNVVLALLRIEKEGLIAKSGNRHGEYRVVENDIDEIDLEEEYGEPWNIRLPLSIHNLVNIYPKNIIVPFAGTDMGKSAFNFQLMFNNMDEYPGRIHYFSSEMGSQELWARLQSFGKSKKEWKERVKFYDKSNNFQDFIKPNDINIIDFLEIYEEFSEIGKPIKAIWEKLNQGIAIVTLQGRKNSELPRGGEFGLEKARLSVVFTRRDKDNLCKIIKAKNWKSSMNPNGLVHPFALVDGCKIIGRRTWMKEEEYDALTTSEKRERGEV